MKRIALMVALCAASPTHAPYKGYPDEYRLVGWGCEGAGDKPLFRNEEDEFPLCKAIDPI